jgi:CIC family chloride channel protein
MIVSSISFAISKYFEPYSMDVKSLAMKGDVFTNDKDQNILATISTSNLIENNFQPIYSKDSLGDMVELIAKSKRNIFPVIDNQDRLLGVILLDNIREIMFKTELYDNVFVSDLMTNAPAVIIEHESMENVMKIFDETGAWNLHWLCFQIKYFFKLPQ